MLRSARLSFRRPKAADADAILSAYAGDADVTRYLAWPRHTRVEDARAFIAWSEQQWRVHAAGPLLIEYAHTGELIGASGFACDLPASAHVGYVLARAAWGRGLATETLAAMVEAAPTFGLRRLSAAVHPAHRASQRVLEKGGFHLNARFVPAGFPNLAAADSGGGTAEAWLYVRPVALTTERLTAQEDAAACAAMMAASEPWITLKRSAAALVPVLCDPLKEVHLVRDPQGVAAFVILDLRGLTNGYVQTVCVRPDCRGAGLGGLLLTWAEQRIYAQSPNVFLCVSSFNHRAQAFYRRLGYETVGRFRDFLVAGHDEVLLRKTVRAIR